LLLGDARRLPFADSKFDAVFIAFTLELFDDADLLRVLNEIRRVLRPTGRLGVVSMSKEAHESIMTDIYVWMHRHFPHFVDCRPIAVEQRLREAGFHVERIEKMSIWGLPVAIALASNPNAMPVAPRHL
jgi:demethylmenaquinone methyltransferase/2-methoxy-6-polyprenyl-1,4-benzoquinol methylase